MSVEYSLVRHRSDFGLGLRFVAAHRRRPSFCAAVARRAGRCLFARYCSRLQPPFTLVRISNVEHDFTVTVAAMRSKMRDALLDPILRQPHVGEQFSCEREIVPTRTGPAPVFSEITAFGAFKAIEEFSPIYYVAHHRRRPFMCAVPPRRPVG
jgi:hypothetical protein